MSIQIGLTISHLIICGVEIDFSFEIVLIV